MASHFDDLDRKKLDETHAQVFLLIKQLAALQARVDKALQIKADSAWGRRYLRGIIRRLREENGNLKSYNRQLESELRLRGLE